MLTYHCEAAVSGSVTSRTCDIHLMSPRLLHLKFHSARESLHFHIFRVCKLTKIMLSFCEEDVEDFFEAIATQVSTRKERTSGDAWSTSELEQLCKQSNLSSSSLEYPGGGGLTHSAFAEQLLQLACQFRDGLDVKRSKEWMTKFAELGMDRDCTHKFFLSCCQQISKSATCEAVVIQISACLQGYDNYEKHRPRPRSSGSSGSHRPLSTMRDIEEGEEFPSDDKS